MIKSALLTLPHVTEKHVKLYGWILFFIGALYSLYAVMLMTCYQPFGGILLRGVFTAWLGMSLSAK